MGLWFLPSHPEQPLLFQPHGTQILSENDLCLTLNTRNTHEWDNADGIRTLKEKVESVNFPVGEDEEYKNDSNEILKSIGVEEEEESDSDSNL